MRDSRSVESMSIRSDPAGFRRVRTWVAGIARAVGFEDDEIRELGLAVSEACSNIHRHAYGGRIDGRIDLEVGAEAGTIRISIRDYGAPFDVSRYRPPSLDRPSEDGYGIFLMRRLTDDVVWLTEDSGTRVEMVRACRAWKGETVDR